MRILLVALLLTGCTAANNTGNQVLPLVVQPQIVQSAPTAAPEPTVTPDGV